MRFETTRRVWRAAHDHRPLRTDPRIFCEALRVKESDQAESLKQRIVDSLVRLAPRRWKRVFCDYEWHEGETSFVGSEVTLAVIKRFLSGVECVPLNLIKDGQIITNFKDLAQLAMHANGTRHCTIDLIVRTKDDHEWYFDFSPPARLSATLSGDLEAAYRNPELKKPYRKFVAHDEWLARIPS